MKGLNTTYPPYNFKSRDRLRMENAYHDTIFFYKLTNHLNPDLAQLAYRKDRKEGFKERRLGLIHPREIPPGLRLPQSLRTSRGATPVMTRSHSPRASSTCTSRLCSIR